MDWKLRQYLYHSCFNLDDNLAVLEYTVDENPTSIEDTIFSWFYVEPTEIIYPYKSFFVATVYSICASHYFGNTPLYYLRDSEFLYGNDPFYQTYDRQMPVYDNIFKYIKDQRIDVIIDNRGLTPKVRDYFLREFLIEVI
jgi:hypothetical protein